MLVKISDIRFDSKYVVREINQDTVNDYAQAINEGASLPKPVIFFDGTHYWLGDGRHRITAHKQAGHADIEVEIRNGTERDAYIYGVSSQNKHGLRLSTEDKRRAVKTILADDEWSMKWNDSEIARMCQVSSTFVKNVRVSNENSSHLPTSTLKLPSGTDELDTAIRDEIPYTTPSGKRSTKKNPAVKRAKRAKESRSHYDWKQFDKNFGAILREVDVLGKIYNRHNTEDAELLRSDLGAWKSNFKEWEDLLKSEKEQACASA